MTHDANAPEGPDRNGGRDRKIEDNKRALEYGSSGSTADLAVEGKPRLEDRFIDAPYSRPAKPMPDGQPIDQLAEKKAVVGDDQEALIDEAVEESFPASDPPSPKRTT